MLYEKGFECLVVIINCLYGAFVAIKKIYLKFWNFFILFNRYILKMYSGKKKLPEKRNVLL